jgi:glycosyltransferase involved in cell wall biosynthesis
MHLVSDRADRRDATEDRPIGVIVSSNCPLPEISGGRKRTSRMIEAMQRAGLEPHVLSIADDMRPGELAPAFRSRGWIAVPRVQRPRPSTARRGRQHTLRLPTPTDGPLVEQIRELARRAALVQFEEIWAVQHVLAGGFSAPTVVSLHNVDSKARAGGALASGVRARARHRYRMARLAAVEDRAVRVADLTVCVSAGDQRHFEQAGAKRLLLVPNGVDERLFEGGRREQTRDVLFFGQLAYRPNAEGIIRFIEAGWPRVRAHAPGTVLRIAGPDAGADVVRAAEQSDGVELLGLVPDLMPELASARAVVAPIRFGGGTRIKVLEAMAAACPVVGTALAVEEIGFVDGRQGLIRETDEALADGLLELLRDSTLAERLGTGGRVLARSYGWNRVTEPLEAFYAEAARHSWPGARAS